MALNNNFYNDIFEKEKYWTELANKNLLNIYYLNGKDGLKEFYLIKKEELEYEYNLTNNDIIGRFLNIVNEILTQIELMTKEYREGKKINMDLLSKTFLVNQMNNNVDSVKSKELTELQIKKQLLQDLKGEIKDFDDSYLYDDFPEEEEDYEKTKAA